MPSPFFFDFWPKPATDNDIDMNENVSSPQIPMQPMNRGTPVIPPPLPHPHELGRVATSTHPLANLPTTIPKPLERGDQSGELAIAPGSQPSTIFRFSGKSSKTLKRSARGPLPRRNNEERNLRQDVSQVEKARLVEQQDLATRAVIDQKTKRIDELEVQVEDYRSQLETFAARMNELEQKLVMGPQNINAGASGEITPRVTAEIASEEEAVRMILAIEGGSKTVEEEVAVEKGDEMKKSKERTLEKGKAKQRIIPDEDEEMEEESETESDGEEQNGSGDDRRGSDSDDAPEMHGGQTSVPKPIVHYQRPRGGAGPRLKVDPTKPYNPTSNTASASKTPLSNIPPIPASLGMTAEQIAAIVQVVMAVQGDNKSATPPRSKKKNVTGTIVRQSNRKRDARSTELVTAVRQHMNLLLRIQHDKDICKVPQPSKTAVEAFGEDSEDGPSLVPMRLALGYKKKEAWNVRLAEMFFDDFLEQNKTKIVITEEEWPIIYEKFWQRFSNLKKEWKAWQNKEGEDEKDAQQRNFLKAKKTQKTTRRDSRRNHLSNHRIEIAEGNKRRSDGTVDEVWHFLWVVATSLGLGGTSSDESSVEASNSRKYVIKSVEWRNRDLIPYLQMIDRDFNRYNRYGNMKAGNPYRERTRLAGAKASTRAAIQGLPRNFYDGTWLANLSNEETNFLQPGPQLDLPTIIEYND